MTKLPSTHVGTGRLEREWRAFRVAMVAFEALFVPSASLSMLRVTGSPSPDDTLAMPLSFHPPFLTHLRVVRVLAFSQPVPLYRRPPFQAHRTHCAQPGLCGSYPAQYKGALNCPPFCSTSDRRYKGTQHFPPSFRLRRTAGPDSCGGAALCRTQNHREACPGQRSC